MKRFMKWAGLVLLGVINLIAILSLVLVIGPAGFNSNDTLTLFVSFIVTTAGVLLIWPFALVCRAVYRFHTEE